MNNQPQSALVGVNLKKQFIDKHRHTTSAPTLDAAAHMVLEIDDPTQVSSVGMSFLARSLQVSRVDLGFATKKNHLYRAHAEYREAGVASTLGVKLPNQSRLLQRVWNTTDPVMYRAESLEALSASFSNQAVKSLLAQSLRVDNGPAFGIVCMDDLQTNRHWQIKEVRLVQEFCSKFFAPLLSVSKSRIANSHLQKPSPAELAAVQLAAEGLSYKRIAASLNKSVRTVEFQLRSARAKTGARNQVELIRLCEKWLD